MFRVDAWCEWLLADKDLKPSYVKTMGRRVGFMERAGFSWPSFFQAPEAARAEVRSFVAAAKRRGAVCMARECLKAANLVAEYAASWDTRYVGVSWDLVKEPRRRFDPYLPSEVQVLAATARRSGHEFTAARRAAIVWLLANASWRKGELWTLRVDDFDQARRAVLLREAEKDGNPGWVLLPAAAWDPGLPLQRYLAARLRLAGPGGALWVTVMGRPLSRAGFGNEMQWLRSKSGVKANFNRFRHTRNTIMDDAGVPLMAAQRENRHQEPKSTLWYMHGSSERRRSILAQHGVPGYEDEPVLPPVAVQWSGLGLSAPPAEKSSSVA